MDKRVILLQDEDAICGLDGYVAWVPSRSTCDLGRGPGVLPMVGIPKDVVDELRVETAVIAAIVPSKKDLSSLISTRIWAYFIRRANGQIEHRVTVVDQSGDGTVVEAVNTLNDECLLPISQWMFEQAIKPKPEAVE